MNYDNDVHIDRIIYSECNSNRENTSIIALSNSLQGFVLKSVYLTHKLTETFSI